MKTIFKVGASYVMAQLAVGIEIGVGAAYAVVQLGWPIEGAMALLGPIGLPLVALHLALSASPGTAAA